MKNDHVVDPTISTVRQAIDDFETFVVGGRSEGSGQLFGEGGFHRG